MQWAAVRFVVALLPPIILAAVVAIAATQLYSDLTEEDGPFFNQNSPNPDRLGAARRVAVAERGQSRRRSRSSGRHACIICMENEQTVGFLHGRTIHQCCCQNCADVWQREGNGCCPVCSVAFERVIGIFQ